MYLSWISLNWLPGFHYTVTEMEFFAYPILVYLISKKKKITQSILYVYKIKLEFNWPIS